MYCYHFVYTHAFSLQKQLLIFRERTFIPLAQLLSILLIMWFQNICSANLIPNLFYNVGEHGRSLANQIFIRLREKKNQPVSPKRTWLYWFVTIGANLKKRFVCRCEVKTLLCNKITRRTHSIVIVNYTLCGFRWKRIIYLSNILIKTQ